jgi:hypothetical protein
VDGRDKPGHDFQVMVQRDQLDERFHETYRFRTEDLPTSLRGALATKQSIARRTRLWIASLIVSAPCAEPVARNDGDDIDMIGTSKSLN